MLPTVTATATDAPLVADGFLARAHGRQAAATTTRTNLGPLTTPWTPPPSCQSVYAPCDTCSVIFAAQACGPDVDGYLADEQSCWPPTGTAVPVPATRGALAGWGVYSPGIVCPVGFTSVVASTYGANNFGFQFPLTAGETAVGCCPIFETLQGGAFSASLDPNGHQTCKLAVTTGVVELIKCTIGGTPETHPVPWSFRSFTMSQYDIYAPLIQIVWKSSDIPKGVLPPNVPASTTSASINGAATQSALPAPLGNTVDQSRLSDGALAGIIIGTILALLAIGLGIFWCLRRRNRQQKHTLIPKPPHGDAEEYGSDLAIATNGFWTDGGAYGPPEFAHRGYHVAGSEKTLVGRATAPPENVQPGAGLSYSDDRQGREYEMTASDPFYDPHLEANMKFAGMPPGIWGGREDSPGPARVPAGRGS